MIMTITAYNIYYDNTHLPVLMAKSGTRPVSVGDEDAKTISPIYLLSEWLSLLTP